MKPIIKVEGLGKQYRLGGQRAAYGTLRESLTAAVAAPLRRLRSRNGSQNETIWALRDVTMSVQPGEVVGVIGRNGAGKSTLLKILSRITEPTLGRVELYGRVGSLLEVGTGFHPELTGRENIQLNGAILGMTRAEIDRKFDEIVAFSEIEKFLDTPVKRYSSGMHMRLAFAVASHLEPEILLVDEVLAVGDAEFQKKCLGKMGDVAREGRTVLFVSHNMTAVQNLCQRVAWMQDGRLLEDGDSRQVISRYLKKSSTPTRGHVWDDPQTAPGNDQVKLHSVSVRPQDGDPTDALTIRTPLIMDFEYWNLQPDTRLNLSLVVFNDEGAIAFNTGPIDEPEWHGRAFPAGLFRSSCLVPGDLLNDGTHRIRLHVVKDQSTIIYTHEDVLVFDVGEDFESRSVWYGRVVGAVRPRLTWKTELLEKSI